jgi:hypothetical protein
MSPMTNTKKAALGVAAAGVLSLVAYALVRPAPTAASAKINEVGVSAPAATVGTILAATKPVKLRRSGKFVGEWEQTSGSVKVICNGKLAKEVPVAGKHFSITDENGTLRFSDNACEFPLKVQGSIATAASDTCAPKNGGAPPVKITKQTLETDGEVAKVAFEGRFQSTLAQNGNKLMDCTVLAETAARRL